MALQFHSNIKQAYANLVLGSNRVFSSTDATATIAVFSGVQPAASTVVANWSQYNGTSGTNRLAVYTAAQAPTWTRTNRTFAITVIPATSPTALNTGTATWALIFSASMTITNLNAVNMPAVHFLVVPVTDVTGNGVIRFQNVSFTSGQSVPIADGSLTLS